MIMSTRSIALGIASLIVALSGQARAESVALPPAPEQVDLLLVIDRATLTAPVRQRVLDALPTFLSLVEGDYGLSLHLAVSTTDMGTGAFDTCGPGDGGRFQATPRGSCSGLQDGNFLVSDVDVYGAPVRNYDGDLIEALDCILPVGGQGCAYGQPVAAIQAALDGSVSENDNFLRSDAALVVLVVTGADDCTAGDPLLYDPAQADTLGPLTPFRCFEHGVTCDRAIDRQAGAYQSCTPRVDSAQVRDPRSLAAFLIDLEPEPGNVVFGLIAGPTGAAGAMPVEVGLDGDGNPQVLPSCIGGDTAAIPATRLAALAGELPQRSVIASLCKDDFQQAMLDLGKMVSNVLYPPPPPPPPPGPDAAPGDITDAGDGGGAIDGRGGCGCSARADDHAGSLLLGLALVVLLYRRRTI